MCMYYTMAAAVAGCYADGKVDYYVLPVAAKADSTAFRGHMQQY